MKVNMQAVNFNAQDSLKEYLDRKMNKLDNYYDKIIAVDVYLKLDNNNSRDNKIGEFRLEVPGDDLIVKKTGQSFEEVIDLATDALKRQIIKRKEKMAP